MSTELAPKSSHSTPDNLHWLFSGSMLLYSTLSTIEKYQPQVPFQTNYSRNTLRSGPRQSICKNFPGAFLKVPKPTSHNSLLHCETRGARSVGSLVLLRWWKISVYSSSISLLTRIPFKSRGRQPLPIKGQIEAILGFQDKKQYLQLFQRLLS